MLAAAISRRSPAADPGTRTVHVEIDVADTKREIPVNTTGEATLEVGEAARATAIPLYAASISGDDATVFVAEEGVAHKKTFPVLGERESDVFLQPSLKAGTQVVSEGQFLLMDGDRVAAKQVPYATAQAKAAPPTAPRDAAQ
jgi:hypothetical protein